MAPTSSTAARGSRESFLLAALQERLGPQEALHHGRATPPAADRGHGHLHAQPGALAQPRGERLCVEPASLVERRPAQHARQRRIENVHAPEEDGGAVEAHGVDEVDGEEILVAVTAGGLHPDPPGALRPARTGIVVHEGARPRQRGLEVGVLGHHHHVRERRVRRPEGRDEVGVRHRGLQLHVGEDDDARDLAIGEVLGDAAGPREGRRHVAAVLEGEVRQAAIQARAPRAHHDPGLPAHRHHGVAGVGGRCVEDLVEELLLLAEHSGAHAHGGVDHEHHAQPRGRLREGLRQIRAPRARWSPAPPARAPARPSPPRQRRRPPAAAAARPWASLSSRSRARAASAHRGAWPTP